jgi:hypothetical protein
MYKNGKLKFTGDKITPPYWLVSLEHTKNKNNMLVYMLATYVYAFHTKTYSDLGFNDPGVRGEKLNELWLEYLNMMYNDTAMAMFTLGVADVKKDLLLYTVLKCGKKMKDSEILCYSLRREWKVRVN